MIEIFFQIEEKIEEISEKKFSKEKNNLLDDRIDDRKIGEQEFSKVKFFGLHFLKRHVILQQTTRCKNDSFLTNRCDMHFAVHCIIQLFTFTLLIFVTFNNLSLF